MSSVSCLENISNKLNSQLLPKVKQSLSILQQDQSVLKMLFTTATLDDKEMLKIVNVSSNKFKNEVLKMQFLIAFGDDGKMHDKSKINFEIICTF